MFFCSFFQAVRLSQPQSEPPLYDEPKSLANVLAALGIDTSHLILCDTLISIMWYLCNFDILVKVNETYNRSIDPIPSYISSLTSPIRKKHKDDLLVTKTPVRDFDFWLCCDLSLILSLKDFYNAWEEDIAVVNIFFGKETVMGEKRPIISIKPDFYFRIREEHQDGPCGLHRLSWRTLWPLSRLQHRLLCRDHLLDSCQGVEKHAAEQGKVIFFCTSPHKKYITIGNKNPSLYLSFSSFFHLDLFDKRLFRAYSILLVLDKGIFPSEERHHFWKQDSRMSYRHRD